MVHRASTLNRVLDCFLVTDIPLLYDHSWVVVEMGETRRTTSRENIKDADVVGCLREKIIYGRVRMNLPPPVTN